MDLKDAISFDSPVLTIISLWNSYIHYIIKNLGIFVYLEKEHLNNILEKFGEGNIKDIPLGFIFLPLECGGLGLFQPNIYIYTFKQSSDYRVEKPTTLKQSTEDLGFGLSPFTQYGTTSLLQQQNQMFSNQYGGGFAAKKPAFGFGPRYTSSSMKSTSMKAVPKMMAKRKVFGRAKSKSKPIFAKIESESDEYEDEYDDNEKNIKR
ncbi:hypothetical protein M0811_05426 [Anaeramoeba ignava]|uniref:Uncharacterized protein n=1 Tax=Anaeramoeba ignava TaxID=1746090 RepID=A0A9Q0LSG3_ANAIG|nr:hypothetical protein M0811_05426 [Anaeramoeba ignava]